MKQDNLIGCTESSVFMNSYNKLANQLEGSNTVYSREEPITQQSTIDFNQSVVKLSIPSHYFVYTTTCSSPDTVVVSENTSTLNTTRFPLFLKGYSSINVPNKTEAVLRRFVSKRKLMTINQDQEVAIELCLLFLCNLERYHTARQTRI